MIVEVFVLPAARFVVANAGWILAAGLAGGVALIAAGIRLGRRCRAGAR